MTLHRILGGPLPANPMPHTGTVNAIRQHFRRWVVKGTPPPSRPDPCRAGLRGPALNHHEGAHDR